MKKFEGILICTDLDGTLVRSDGTVSESDLKTIEYFKSEGGLFTFITARMLCHTAEVRAMIHANAPFGCLNGAAIYDEKKEDFIWIHKIDASVFELASYVAEHTSEIGIALVGFRNVYFYGDTPAVTKYRTDRKLPDLKCTIGEVGEPLCKLLLIAESNEKVFAAADISRYSTISSKRINSTNTRFTLLLIELSYTRIASKSSFKRMLTSFYAREQSNT